MFFGGFFWSDISFVFMFFLESFMQLFDRVGCQTIGVESKASAEGVESKASHDGQDDNAISAPAPAAGKATSMRERVAGRRQRDWQRR